MTRSDLVDLSVHLHFATVKAWLVSDTGDSADAVWIPHSQGELEQDPDGRSYTLTCPEWLAKEKGLI